MRGLRRRTSTVRVVAARASIATALAALLLATSADANSAGGAQAPSLALAGGSEYGVSHASAVAHPVVTSLTLPSTATAGRPPRVTMRLDEPHVATVDVTVAVHDLTTRQAALVARMGWIHTGRTLAVVWPHGATLKPGSYRIAVSAHDHSAHSLTRTAHSSGVATLTITAPPVPPTAPAQAAPATTSSSTHASAST